MKEVQEKLLPGELGVSTRIFLLILPQDWGIRGLKKRLLGRPGRPQAEPTEAVLMGWMVERS